jgi:hypothetical protein
VPPQISGTATVHPDDTVEYFLRTLLGAARDDDQDELVTLAARRVLEATLCVGRRARLRRHARVSCSAALSLSRRAQRVSLPPPTRCSRDTRLPLLLSLGLRSASEAAVRDLVTHLETERPWAAARRAAATAEDR